MHVVFGDHWAVHRVRRRIHPGRWGGRSVRPVQCRHICTAGRHDVHNLWCAVHAMCTRDRRVYGVQRGVRSRPGCRGRLHSVHRQHLCAGGRNVLYSVCPWWWLHHLFIDVGRLYRLSRWKHHLGKRL